MAKQTQTKEPKAASTRSFAAAAEEAPDRPTILPALDFGKDKLAVVSYLVEFQEAEGRPTEWEDKINGGMAQGYAINVRVLDVLKAPEGDAAWSALGEDRSLMFRDDPKTTLAAGVFNAYKKNGNTLLGLRARITTRSYKHERFGQTRAYDVVPVHDTNDDAPTAGLA